MKFAVDLKSTAWRIWAATLVLLMAAVSGWTPGYPAVIIMSFLQIPYAAPRSKSILSFASQVRIVYFGLTLPGL